MSTPKEATAPKQPASTPAPAAAGGVSVEIDNSANTFAVTLAQLGKGNNLAELSSELGRMVRAVRATGKKGKLTYVLHVVPVDGTDGAQVVLTDEIKLTTPSPDRKSSLFFTTDEGQLTRRDPNQRDWIDEAAEAAARVERDEAARLQNKVTLDQLKAAAK